MLEEIKELGVDFKTRKTVLQTENGSEFKNSNIEALLLEKGIQYKNSNAYSPQENGAVERANGTVKTDFRTVLLQEQSVDWVSKFAECIERYNNCIHSTTKMTPNDLVHKITKRKSLSTSSAQEVFQEKAKMCILVETVQNNIAKRGNSNNKNKSSDTYTEKEVVLVRCPYPSHVYKNPLQGPYQKKQKLCTKKENGAY